MTRRHLLNLLAGLSLLLCVAVVVMWSVSYHIHWRHDRSVRKVDAGFQLSARRVVGSANGYLSWIDTTLSWKPPTRDYVERFPPDAWGLIQRPEYQLDSTNEVIIQFPGVRFQRAANPAPGLYHPDAGTLSLVLRHWLLFLLTSLLPLSRIMLWLRRRRAAQSGLCPTCGYDLRATLERCSECGTALARQ